MWWKASGRVRRLPFIDSDFKSLLAPWPLLEDVEEAKKVCSHGAWELPLCNLFSRQFAHLDTCLAVAPTCIDISVQVPSPPPHLFPEHIITNKLVHAHAQHTHNPPAIACI
mmetsp:Transcript_12167/g.34240  ORF Transcript_12167/g.34240 Transcript_12167/m.34240 type:complete len:111 (+) Transcript_12167:1040-1372(+)